MHKVTFFNIGNADSIRLDLSNGKKILFDYADMGVPGPDNDQECDLSQELRDDLGDRDYLDVVAFTHLDHDHYAGSSDFFYFEHVPEYQDDLEDGPRIHMNLMWVPAAVITEELPSDSSSDEARAIQKEARGRFKAKTGIRVFSAPNHLRKWCRENGVDFDSRRHLVSDAGTLVPEFSLDTDGVEFFVHSPFAMRQNANEVVDRNNDALAMHATFHIDGTTSKLFLSSDVGWDCLSDIVTMTEDRGNEARLEWDIFKLPHHCSHHSLSSKPREGDKSEPEPLVAKLFEEYRQRGGVVVSTSNPIPAKGSDADKKGSNPPHRQAANYYKQDVVDELSEFIVTMEHPSEADPSPLVIEIDGMGPTVRKARRSPAVIVTGSPAPRAG